MDKYLLPKNDDLLTRDSGEWVKEKLFYVQRYIDAFETAMRNQSWRRRIYIDLFSGPGKCNVRGTNDYVLGSPLLALITQYPFTDYYFGDLDKENIDHLRERANNSNIPQDHIHYLTGNANQKVQDVVRDIEQTDKVFIKGVRSCLNLAFLDPEGLELEWATVEALGKMRTMDLIIHYSQNGLTRNLKNAFLSMKKQLLIDFLEIIDGEMFIKKPYLEKKPLVSIGH